MRLTTGILYDVLKFEMKVDPIVLPRDIYPMWNFKGSVFGKVFTVVGRKTEIGEDIADRMIDEFENGSILLMQANDNSRAHFGDITALMLKEMGCKGAVIQGWTRDIEGIEELDFKIWAKGIQPQNSKDRWIVEDIQREIVIGNQFITPKDYILADRDAIIVIKGELVNEALRLGKILFDKEINLITKIIKEKLSAKEIKETYGQW